MKTARSLMLTLLLAVAAISATVGVCAPAVAGPRATQKAEVRRLTTELEKLAERGAWSGVERTYLQLVTLERRGAEVSHDAHRLGAQSAEQRGDMFDVWRRLRAAQAVAFRDDTAQWLATVQVTYDRVVIEVSPLYFGELPLEAPDLGFDPTARRTVATARASLEARRSFDGLLPLGRYRVAHTSFEVLGLGDGQKVTVWPEAGRARARDDAAAPGPRGGPTEVALQVTASGIDRPAYEGATQVIARKLERLDEVDTVTVVPLPPPVLYVDFDPERLEVLSQTAQTLAVAAREQLELPAEAVQIEERWLVLPPEQVERTALEDVTVELEGGKVSFASFTNVREAPDRTAPAPGIQVTLADDVDAAVGQAAIQTILDDEASATVLGLVIER